MTTTDEEFESLFLGGLDNSYIEVDERVLSDNYPSTADWSA